MKQVLQLLVLLFFSANIYGQELTTSQQDSLAFELCQLYAIDQTIRNSDYMEILKERIIKFDSLNFDKFISFVKKNGFPNKKMVGEKNWEQQCVSSTGFIYLVHNPTKIAKEYYDLFMSEVNKGNLSPLMFSYALDRHYVSTEGRSYYDTPYKAWTSASGVCLQDKAKSDSLRIGIGLPPLPESECIDCSKIEISSKPNYNNPIYLVIPE